MKGFFQTAMELLAYCEIPQKCFTVKNTKKLDMCSTARYAIKPIFCLTVMF